MNDENSLLTLTMPIHIEVGIPLTDTGAVKGRSSDSSGERGEWGLVIDSQTHEPRARDTAPSGRQGVLLETLRVIDRDVAFIVTSINERVGRLIFPNLHGMDEGQKETVTNALRAAHLRFIKGSIVRDGGSGILKDDGKKET